MPDYDNLLYLPHPISKKHPRMPVEKRAAQFAPFAALSGHADAVEETARITEEKLELTEERKEQINRVLQSLLPGDDILVVYFTEDEKKEGGCYQTKTGKIKKIRDSLLLEDGIQIPIDNLFSIERIEIGLPQSHWL
jgi:hypothetical protein